MRIVIVGAGGMLGHKLFQKLSEIFPATYAVLHGSRNDIENRHLFDTDKAIDHVDARDHGSLCAILNRIDAQIVLNCTGITKRHEVSHPPGDSIALNALLPHRLVEWAQGRDAKIINFSTDCVFDGSAGNYTEDSLPTAQDLYGRTKALGEIKGPQALTLRSSFIGRELRHRTELLEWFLAQNGQRIKGFRNALYTGVSTIELARVVADIIQHHQQLTGLYHLAGEVISKYELLVLARDVFDVDIEIIPDDGFSCHRHLDGFRLLNILKRDIPPWPTMMAELAADRNFYDQKG